MRGSIFHSVVAQLLFATFGVRPSGHTNGHAFVTTRVKDHNKGKWVKLKRVLKYLHGTKGVKLTLRVDSLNVSKWWVDTVCLSHHDCRGHSGGMMSLGGGAVISALKTSAPTGNFYR